MSAPVLVESSCTHCRSGMGSFAGFGLGAAPPPGFDVPEMSPAGARAAAAVGLGIGGAIGYGSYRLFKAKHPVWGVIVGLIAAGGLSMNAYTLASGKASI